MWSLCVGRYPGEWVMVDDDSVDVVSDEGMIDRSKMQQSGEGIKLIDS